MARCRYRHGDVKPDDIVIRERTQTAVLVDYSLILMAFWEYEGLFVDQVLERLDQRRVFGETAERLAGYASPTTTSCVLLIARGANVKDNEGVTPLQTALREGGDEIAQLLQNKPQPPSGKLRRIVASIWRSVSGAGHGSSD